MRARMFIIALASTSLLAFGSAAYASHGHGSSGGNGVSSSAAFGGIAVTQVSTVSISKSGGNFVGTSQTVNIGNSSGGHGR